MKKLFLLLLAFMLLGFGMGCDGDTSTNANSAVPNNQFNKTATVQGTVFNATTGARIGDSSLKITMVRGTGYYPPAALYNTTTDATMLGDFVFTGVPITLGGTATYRVVASMDGYETFEGYFSKNENLQNGNPDDADTEDTVYNYIGNIYMFPLGQTAPSYTFYVEYDDERISDATVYLEWKPGKSDETTNVIYPASSADALGQTMVGTTDTAGAVTFSGANLVLGGVYRVTVLPMMYNGIQLGLYQGPDPYRAIQVGLSDVEQVIDLFNLSPGTDDEGLYVVSASNHDWEDIDSNGVLTLTFNMAVTLVDEEDCHATLHDFVDAELDADDSVDVTGSGTTTLVFTPDITEAPGADDVGTYVNFTNCYIRYGDDDLNIKLFSSVQYLDGGDYSLFPSRVYITAEE